MTRIDVYNKLVRRKFTLTKDDIKMALAAYIKTSGLYPEGEKYFMEYPTLKMKLIKDEYDEDDANIPDGIVFEAVYEVEQEIKEEKP